MCSECFENSCENSRSEELRLYLTPPIVEYCHYGKEMHCKVINKQSRHTNIVYVVTIVSKKRKGSKLSLLFKVYGIAAN